MTLLLACIAIGALMPLQTAINSRLRLALGSPFTASFASFLIGASGLALALLALEGPGATLAALSAAAGAPWWQWIGGLLGVVLLTTNIFAFAHLGGVETALWPILGSIVSSLAVDAFAWFGAHYRPLTVLRALGALAVLIGVALASGVASGGLRRSPAMPALDPATAWAWRIGAFVAGTGGAIQGAVNGALGQTIGAPLPAALVSFLVGTASIGVVTVAALALGPRSVDEGGARPTPELGGRASRLRGPAWMWIGGLFGALFVAVMTHSVPRIGVGPANVASLAGLTLASLAVDEYGLFEAPRKPVGRWQIAGVLLVLGGVMGVQFG